MPRYSVQSVVKLKDCHEDLQSLFREVIKHFDNAILTGHRDKEEQEYAFKQGHTQLRFPNGKHNKLPSKAVDSAPYPIDWDDRERFHYYAGFVKGIAASMGLKIRWGGDWDQDTEVSDNKFDDLVHFELVD